MFVRQEKKNNRSSQSTPKIDRSSRERTTTNKLGPRYVQHKCDPKINILSVIFGFFLISNQAR